MKCAYLEGKGALPRWQACDSSTLLAPQTHMAVKHPRVVAPEGLRLAVATQSSGPSHQKAAPRAPFRFSTPPVFQSNIDGFLQYLNSYDVIVFFCFYLFIELFFDHIKHYPTKILIYASLANSQV